MNHDQSALATLVCFWIGFAVVFVLSQF